MGCKFSRRELFQKYNLLYTNRVLAPLRGATVVRPAREKCRFIHIPYLRAKMCSHVPFYETAPTLGNVPHEKAPLSHWFVLQLFVNSPSVPFVSMRSAKRRASNTPPSATLQSLGTYILLCTFFESQISLHPPTSPLSLRAQPLHAPPLTALVPNSSLRAVFRLHWAYQHLLHFLRPRLPNSTDRGSVMPDESSLSHSQS